MQTSLNFGTLDKLLAESSLGRIGIVVLPSRRDYVTVSAHLQTLLLQVPVPEERIFTYAPPDEASSCPYGSKGCFSKPRQEEIPVIPDPNLTFVIVDCRVDTGKTLKITAEMLIRQGTPAENIQYFGYIDDEFVPVLVGVRDLLDYTKHRRKD